MATILSAVTGNFTTASTWQACNAAAELDSEAATGSVSTSTLDSATFTPGAVTVDGIALKLAGRLASPTGTITVSLRNATTEIATVTANVSALDANGLGWHFFKFSTTPLLVTATTYFVRVVCSAAGGQVTLFRDATSNNWSRQLRTTTTGAPVATNKIIVAGFYNGASNPALLTAVTVTMNDTSGASYGPTVSGGPPQGVTVNNGGTLSCGVAASTAYTFKWKGILAVYGGGVLSFGTSGTPIPSTSSLLATCDLVADGDTGIDIQNGGTFNSGGATKTVMTLMTADKAAAATVITLASTSGWAVSDALCFAATTRTVADCETKNVLTVDSSTQVTLSAGLTSAHSGTTPTPAEVGNLTRNVRIVGTSTSIRGYVVVRALSTILMRYTEMKFLGANAGNKTGVTILTTAGGTCDIQFCSFWSNQGSGGDGFLVSGGTADSFTISNNVVFSIQNSALTIPGTSGIAWTVSGNLLMKNASGTLCTFGAHMGTITNNIFVGSNNQGVVFNAISSVADTNGTISGNTAHSNNGSGVEIASSSIGQTMTTWAIWRNNSTGGLSLNGVLQGMTFDTCVMFGNAAANCNVFNNSRLYECTMVSCSLAGDTTFSSPVGLQFSNASIGLPVALDFYLNSCDFGVTSGIKTTHTTADIQVGSTSQPAVRVIGNNTRLSSGTPISISQPTRGSFVEMSKYQATAGNHQTWIFTGGSGFGTIATDTTFFKAASPSSRLTPGATTPKLESGGKLVAVASGVAITVSVWVRKSAVGDGTAYTGSQPRLIVKRNDAIGITADTVLATASASTGTWEKLTGTTASPTDNGVVEIKVDCDGAAGWVNVDDWATTQTELDTGSELYWRNGLSIPALTPPVSAGGGLAANPIAGFIL